MNRRTVSVLLLVALASLSGCAGLFGGETTQTPTNDTNATGPVHELPLNGSAVVDTHAAALDDAESFTYQQNATARQLGNRSGIINYKNVTAQTNLAEGSLRSEQELAFQPPRAAYVDGQGNAYTQQSTGANASYQRFDGDEADTTTYLDPGIGGYLDGLNFSDAGTETVDGVTVDKYEVTDPSQVNASAHDPEILTAESIETISVTVAIDRDGVVRSFEYHVTGQNENGDPLGYHLSLQYSDVGSTTVPEPDWLSEARSATR
jgi:hypothetical protein